MEKIITVIKVYTDPGTCRIQMALLWISFVLSVTAFVLFCLDPHNGFH
jgi:hypothetical protein